MEGTIGVTPELSIATSVSGIAGLAPEPPWAIPLTRASMAARTIPTGSSAPKPPSWERSIRTENWVSSPTEILRSLS